MSSDTPRDRAWLVVLEALRDGRDLQISDVTEAADVSKPTARGVLHAAEDAGYFTRDSPRAHTWQVNIGPLADVNDEEYRRAIQTLIAESPG